MYNWEKSNQRRTKHKQTHQQFDSQTPTFSSSFLETEHQLEDLLFLKNKARTPFEDIMPPVTLPTTFSSEKMAEKKLNGKVIARRRTPSSSFSTPWSPSREPDLQDTLFYSASKAENSVFHPPKCAIPPRPKLDISNDQEAIFVKSRSRAQKIYSNLKSLKQPVSPGARLTSLITSLFIKDGKTKKKPTASAGDEKPERRENKSVQASTCSSTRSCLSRNNSSKKRFEDGVKRAVRFCPVGVIVGEDSRPCGHKTVFIDDEDDKLEEQRKKLERENEKKRLKKQQQQRKQRQLEEMALDLLNGYCDSKLNTKPHNHKLNDKANHFDYGANHNQKYDRDHDDHDGPRDDDDDDDDKLSCSSSDLFELDHLSLVGDELPVYETTHFDSKFL